MRCGRWLLAAAGLCVAVQAWGEPGRVVVAMRYLIPKGVSHAGLYLYQPDGKLVRRLTDGGAGQDKRPVFSGDGRMIVFTREFPHRAPECWVVTTTGGKPTRLAAEPKWYRETRDSLSYRYRAEYGDDGLPPAIYTAPDGSFEITPSARPADGEWPDMYQPDWTMLDRKTGRETCLPHLPDVWGSGWVLFPGARGNRPFLTQRGLTTMFMTLGGGSSEGLITFALDVKHKRWVRLARNYAAPYPLPGEAAFLTRAEVRYVPILGSQMTANSDYVERWDADLHHIRYGDQRAAVCYGACCYRQGLVPHVITIR